MARLVRAFLLAGVALPFVDVPVALARSRCTPGRGNCFQLAADHPLSPLVGLLFLLGVASFFVLGVGIALLSQYKDSGANFWSVSEINRIWNDPECPKSLKLLVLTAFGVTLTAMLAVYAIVAVAGTRV